MVSYALLIVCFNCFGFIRINFLKKTLLNWFVCCCEVELQESRHWKLEAPQPAIVLKHGGTVGRKCLLKFA